MQSVRQSLRFYSARPVTNLKFFSKPDCQLCHEADEVLKKTLTKLSSQTQSQVSPVKYIDITKPENEKWFESYRYDIPVLWIEREGYKNVVMMHRLDPVELLEELDQDM